MLWPLVTLSTGTNSLETWHTAKQSLLQHAPVGPEILSTITVDVSLRSGFAEVGGSVMEHLICDEIESTCDIWRGSS